VKTKLSDKEIEQRMEMALAETTLCVRTLNTLEAEGILYVGQLLQCTIGRLKSIRNISSRTIEEILRALAVLGFERKVNDP
jgi:DNA-directed RNA polymerase alpha subunit